MKIRGFRIELGEIEAALNQHPAIRESVVVAVSLPSGEKRLAAYLVPSGVETLSVDALRPYLESMLPEHMTPAAFTVLEALPLSPNGKVDRRGLPAPEFVAGANRTAPRDMLEQRLVALWERMLDVRGIGIRDNFFTLGGHSLTALRLMAEVEKDFSVRLPVSAIFQNPTIEGFAPALRQHASLTWSPAVRSAEREWAHPPFSFRAASATWST